MWRAVIGSCRRRGLRTYMHAREGCVSGSSEVVGADPLPRTRMMLARCELSFDGGWMVWVDTFRESGVELCSRVA